MASIAQPLDKMDPTHSASRPVMSTPGLTVQFWTDCFRGYAHDLILGAWIRRRTGEGSI